MVGPEAFAEVRYLAHAKQMEALDVVPELAAEFSQAFGRPSGGLVHRYRTEDADTIVVALGSVLGTVQDVVDELRAMGARVGALGIACFRPWPADEVRSALEHAATVVVLERAFAVGIGGIVGQNVRLALTGLAPVVHDVVAGLGGRPVTKRSIHELLADVIGGRVEPGGLRFLDMRWDLVERELQRLSAERRTGPHAENILRDIGLVAAGPH
jgi:pyruvate ferredoxin oxidoreductase alpha subunit